VRQGCLEECSALGLGGDDESEDEMIYNIFQAAELVLCLAALAALLVLVVICLILLFDEARWFFKFFTQKEEG
jgi:hypothetical protein